MLGFDGKRLGLPVEDGSGEVGGHSCWDRML
jgi:hypothetical protein